MGKSGSDFIVITLNWKSDYYLMVFGCNNRGGLTGELKKKVILDYLKKVIKKISQKKIHKKLLWEYYKKI